MAASGLLDCVARSRERRRYDRTGDCQAVHAFALQIREEIHGCPNLNGGEDSMAAQRPEVEPISSQISCIWSCREESGWKRMAGKGSRTAYRSAACSVGITFGYG